jgi:integrase
MPTQETKSPSKTRSAKPAKPAKPAVPAYRQRAGYSQAIVTLTDAETRQRRDYWLGEFDQPESRERYHRVIAEWERRGRRLPPPDFDAPPARRADEITIVEVIREYWRWAADYYRPKHTQALDGALTILRQFYGRTAAIDFGPKKLRLLRDHMIRGDGSRRMPWSRKYINSQVQRIRHMFKWAAGHELVPVAVHQSLCTLEALRRGRCEAREGKKVTPVPQHLLDAVLPKLTKPVAALVKLQRLTGARAGELLGMRPCDVEMDDKLGVWTYKPEEHKNAYREHERVIYFGPHAQEVVRPFLRDRATNAFLFSPGESDMERRERQHAERKTPDGQGNEPGTNRKEHPKRKPGARFTTNTYHRAIQYVCDRTFPPPPHLAKRDDETTDAWRDRLEVEELWDELVAWRKAHRFHPHQLRHNAATELRKAFGLEAAQLTLGHASAQITDAIYAERDRAKVIEIMRKIG